eukprot:GHVL01024331.1.p1 GENE.GHVL01024331.1~~GHVL01024331.1.p1  ORF type:complete len:195 (+),score=9.60 GHVL01024331.1:35-586(+)
MDGQKRLLSVRSATQLFILCLSLTFLILTIKFLNELAGVQLSDEFPLILVFLKEMKAKPLTPIAITIFTWDTLEMCWVVWLDFYNIKISSENVQLLLRLLIRGLSLILFLFFSSVTFQEMDSRILEFKWEEASQQDVSSLEELLSDLRLLMAFAAVFLIFQIGNQFYRYYQAGMSAGRMSVRS